MGEECVRSLSPIIIQGRRKFAIIVNVISAGNHWKNIQFTGGPLLMISTIYNRAVIATLNRPTRHDKRVAHENNHRLAASEPKYLLSMFVC